MQKILPFLLLFSLQTAFSQSFKVVGYLPYYRFSWLNDIEFERLTHVNIAFANPDAQGNLSVEGEDIAPAVAKAHQHGCKVFISLAGGYLTPDAEAAWTANTLPTNRPAFIQKIVQYVQANNLDGVDIDLEWQYVESWYSPFVLELKAALEPLGIPLTAALPGSYRYPQITAPCLAAYDWVNMMVYDLRGPWDPTNPGQHSPYDWAEDCIEYWQNQGVPAQKLTLGVPFYGYDFGVDPVASFTHRDIVNQAPANAYLDNVGQKWWNGIPTIQAKTELALDEVAGIMIWEIGQDAFGANIQYSLLRAIDEVVNAASHAKTWQVGPTRNYTVPSAVSNLVADGDTVEIDAGLYTGNVTKWFANNLVIKSVGGGYAHLEAAGNYAEGKAIWVIKGANCTVEGIEFSGCQVPDHNGAGIRQEGQHLTLRNCYFHHNEMGILTSNDGVSDFVFESCEFSHNGYGDGYSHNIYVGNVNSLTMRYCYSHDAHIGHLVKSRARFNNLYYNRLTGENGDGSYEVDMPNGGQAILIGNIIEQSPNSQNGGIVTFGLENQSHPEQQIVLSHNTVLNNRFDGRFVLFSNATSLVKLVNNLFLGPGTLLQGTAAAVDSSHNIRLTNIAAAMLKDPTNFDLRPTANSPCVDAGTDAGSFNGIPLVALYSYLHPMSRTARWFSGSAPDVGAYEFLVSPYRSVEAPRLTLSLYPNPVSSNEILNIQTNQPMEVETVAILVNTVGERLKKITMPKGDNGGQLDLQGLPKGLYFLQMEGFGVWKIVVME